MRHLIQSPADFISGSILAGFGAAGLYLAIDYGLGSYRSIGPGALPAACALLLTACGLAVAYKAMHGPRFEAPPFAWRPFMAVLGSVAAWTLLAERVGLVPASFALVLLAVLAQERPRWLTALATAAVLGVGGSALFILALGIPLHVLRGW